MYQKTIAKEVKFSGNGLHTGEFTNLLLKPSMPNTGIIFRFHKNDNTYDIEANINNLFSTNRGTTLVSSANNNYKIFTTEHLLSALYSLEIDNLIIEIDNIEVPILDGSSKKYITQINNVGIKTFKDKKDYLVIDKEITINGNDNSFIKILPYNGFKITLEINFENKNIGNQKFTLDSLEDYQKEISSSRTFCTFDEIVYLKKQNLAKGGNFDNSIVYSSDKISISEIKEFNKKNKLRIIESINENKVTINNKKLLYTDEAVRHKILDLIGDLALLGKQIKGHIISYKGGHYLNTELVKSIFKLSKMKKKCLYNKEEIKKVLPHRDPFLLIDEIIDIEDGNYVHAIKYVKENEMFLEGHFPKQPIVPGVLIIECLAQASCFLSMSAIKDYENKLMLLSVIKKAKFIKKVIPGDKLELKVNLIKFKLNNAIIKGEAIVNNNTVAIAEWMATVVNRYEN